MQKGQRNWKEIEKQYVYLSKIGFALQFDHKILSVVLLLQYSAQVPFKLDSIHNFENKVIVKCKRLLGVVSGK